MSSTIAAIEDVLLDLDDLVQEKKFIRYNGKLHEIKTPSVNDYLQILLMRRKHLRDAGGEEDEYVQIQQAAGVVAGSLPSIPREELMSMGMERLMKITDAIEKATNPPKKDSAEDANGTKGEGSEDPST